MLRIDDFALRPVRAAARSGRGILTDEAERAIGAVLAGPLPEAVARSLVEHRVFDRVVSELLEAETQGGPDAKRVEELVDRVLQSPALERWIRSPEAGRVMETASDRIVQSAAFRRAMTEVLSSPELRRAISQQTTSFGAETAAATRERARRWDDSAETAVRRWLRRPRQEPWLLPFAGIGTRGVGLVVDAALAQLAFVAATAAITLVVSLVGGLGPEWLAGMLAGIGWLLVAVLYFVGFWSGTGQTPGMRLMRLRVVTRSGAPPSVPRSLVRFGGLILAIIPLFAGFLPVLVDDRRRALQDFLAGTTVVYDPEAAASVSSGSLNETASE